MEKEEKRGGGHDMKGKRIIRVRKDKSNEGESERTGRMVRGGDEGDKGEEGKVKKRKRKRRGRGGKGRGER
jgi:hypothetical protein